MTFTLEGLIIEERHVANMTREISVRVNNDDDDDNNVVRVWLNAERFAATTMWMTIKKARQLLYRGVKVRIDVAEQPSSNGSSSPLYAKNIWILAVHPSTPYLARLLSFSLPQLRQLFDETHTSNDNNLPKALVAACAPVAPVVLQQAYTHVQTTKAAGQQVELFKSALLKEISADIYSHLYLENDLIRAKPKHLHPATISKETHQALQRLEMRFHRPVHGQRNVAVPPTATSQPDHSLDPLHNLPDPSDERRRRYIDQRKRPQIQCMLDWIQSLIQSPTNVHIMDIGGGRGYLGLAVAGTFPQAHVTVVDNNPTSLQAGQERAALAQLNNISFVLCDLNESKQVAKLLLLANQKVDLIVGLHCCGGLAEAAVELALGAQADFCVSTCCFRSNPGLATLTKLVAQELEPSEQQDLDRVATLAVTVDAKDHNRAIRAYNNMRLYAAERRSSENKGNYRLWQESFPLEFSVQNAVLLGRRELKV